MCAIRPRSVSAGLLLSVVFALSPPPATAWNSNPSAGTVICDANFSQSSPLVAADGAGGVFVVWSDFRNSFGQVFAQHLDGNGRALWAANGVAVNSATTSALGAYTLAPDGSGGLLVAWGELRSGSSTSYDVYAQRLSAAGSRLWLSTGAVVCVFASTQDGPQVIADGTGGMIAAWSDSRNSGTTNTDLYAQRLDASGNAAWTANGVVLCNAADLQLNLNLVSDGVGGAIAIWEDRRAGVVNTDLYGQRLRPSDGAGLWASNGSTVSNAASIQSAPDAASDGAGGVTVCFRDQRSGNNDVYAQRVSPAGTRLWGSSDVAVCVNVSSQLEAVLDSDGLGGAFVVWSDLRAGNDDTYAQKLNASGAAQWTADGVAVAAGTAEQIIPALVADAFGGVVVTWHEDANPAQFDVLAMRLTSAGAAGWTAAGVLESYPLLPSAARTVSDGRGGVIVAFYQSRSTTSTDIFAGRVDRFGFAGTAEPVITRVRDVQNDQGGRVKLEFSASYLEFDGFSIVTSYDIFRSVPSSLLGARLDRGARLTRDPDEAARGPGHALYVTSYSGQDYAWELLGAISALDLPSYSYLAATAGDSVAGSNPLTKFMVQARGTSSRYWNSLPDSGYSVDNLAPLAPAPFTGQYQGALTRLHWNPNGETDLAGYRLYRGSSASFTPSPANRIAALPDTGYADPAGAPYVYKLTAVDAHGNESPVATLIPSGTVDASGPTSARELSLARPSPSPAAGPTTIRFTLPRAGETKLAVYDAGGRRVRALASGTLEAGEHSVRFDLADDQRGALPAGLFFIALEQGGRMCRQRLAIVR